MFEFFELYCFRNKTGGRPVDLLYVCGKPSQLDPSDPYILGPSFFRPGLYGKHEDNPGKFISRRAGI